MNDEDLTRRNIARAIRNAPLRDDVRRYLERRLADEREAYESAPASEFQRGRLDMLKDFIALTKE